MYCTVYTVHVSFFTEQPGYHPPPFRFVPERKVLGCSVPWTMRPLDVASLGRRAPVNDVSRPLTTQSGLELVFNVNILSPSPSANGRIIQRRLVQGRLVQGRLVQFRCPTLYLGTF